MGSPTSRFLSITPPNGLVDSYLQLPSVFSKQECDILLERARDLLRGFDLSGHPMVWRT
jgi:hypothetical protein